MVNTKELKKKIIDSGLKSNYIADVVGISRVSFSRKLNGHIPFKASEAYVLCDILLIPEDEKHDIFFANEVH